MALLFNTCFTSSNKLLNVSLQNASISITHLLSLLARYHVAML